jgi:hypothetical protein
MTRGLKAGLLLAALHTAIAGSVAAKYAVDRERLPRVWVKTTAIDPSGVIRGRYVRLWLQPETTAGMRSGEVTLEAAAGRLWARPGHGAYLMERALPGSPGTAAAGIPPPTNAGAAGTGQATSAAVTPGPARAPVRTTLILSSPVAFFIPDGVPDPAVRRPGEELWVEVSLPGRGSLRPLRLGVMKDGRLTPLAF